MFDTIWEAVKGFFEGPSLWYNLTAIILTAAGFIYGIISNYIQNKKNEPVYWIRTTHLFRETVKDVKGLHILYNNKEISDLSSTKFIFWNKGKDAIKQTDIASKNSIKITIDPDYEIFDAFIDKATSEDNNYIIEKQEDGKSVLVKFEYMERNDGVSISLTHTAPSSNKFKVTGKVISGSKIEYSRFAGFTAFSFSGEGKPNNSKKELRATKLIMFLGGLFFVLWSFSIAKEQDLFNLILRYVLLIMGLFYFYIAIFIVRRRIPQKLDEG